MTCDGRCEETIEKCGNQMYNELLGQPFICTLPAGHEGSHIACGTADHHDICIWDNADV